MNTPAAFWARVDVSGGAEACWPWTGATGKDGHGIVKWAGACRYAHRVAYELWTGEPLGEGVIVRHFECDNPP